ncbi:helix-turn-helix domain-containing protein [Streptomyces sp. NBC_01014]|uniref:helix-turn-helix domain-containing protein n=1 Tax=Streptomyces sp. NBC_01014 TaxID=2903719 RepID=UPI0038671C95|nr:helix-turn-helix domain-containing protein [Streptomyces sp. NBC_01014]
MDTQQISAPPRTPSPVRGRATPASGVVHINSHHTSRYTVVGNHLVQHRELSLLAIGLAVHIQSLPAGAKIGIKVLADRYPESETRIAAALRELEAHGYLERTRERLPSGRVITRTVSYNQPGAVALPPVAPSTRPAPGRAARPQAPMPSAAPEPVPPPEPLSQPDRTPVPRNPVPARPSLPQPQAHDLERHRAAIDLLAGLRRHDPRLLLSAHDVRRLAPAVAAWLERGVGSETVSHALSTGLPAPLTRPAGLLAHRLTELLPPPLPAIPAPDLVRRPDPLQNCDRCDRAFRAPEPGTCRSCRTDVRQSAA